MIENGGGDACQLPDHFPLVDSKKLYLKRCQLQYAALVQCKVPSGIACNFPACAQYDRSSDRKGFHALCLKDFARMDTNGDLKIEFNELENGLTKFLGGGGAPHEHKIAKEMMLLYDLPQGHGDGKLDIAEFTLMMLRSRLSGEVTPL